MRYTRSARASHRYLVGAGLSRGRSVLTRLKRAGGERQAKVLETSAYFDAVNFARKFKGKSLFGVGFLNPACPPTTVYAAINVLPGPKTIMMWPRQGQIAEGPWVSARNDFWKANLALRPPG
jgi:cephalosporin-C deacetylase-like acetyl esterase